MVLTPGPSENPGWCLANTQEQMYLDVYCGCSYDFQESKLGEPLLDTSLKGREQARTREWIAVETDPEEKRLWLQKKTKDKGV